MVMAVPVIKVNPYDGEPVFIEEPDAGAGDLQERSAGFRDGLEGVGEIAASQGLIVRQGSEGVLILLQDGGWIDCWVCRWDRVLCGGRGAWTAAWSRGQGLC